MPSTSRLRRRARAECLENGGVANVIGSSTNPTLPFGRDAVAEHYGMIVSVHDLKTDSRRRRHGRDRIRAGTMGARTCCTTWARSVSLRPTRRAWVGPVRPCAVRSPWPEDEGRTRRPGRARQRTRPALHRQADHQPAIAHGLSHEVGSIEVGKLADIVLWRPEYFGAKPQLVLKSGFRRTAWSATPTRRPTPANPRPGPQFGAHGTTPADISVAFVAQAALDQGNDSMRLGVDAWQFAAPGDRPADLRLNSLPERSMSTSAPAWSPSTANRCAPSLRVRLPQPPVLPLGLDF